MAYYACLRFFLTKWTSRQLTLGIVMINFCVAVYVLLGIQTTVKRCVCHPANGSDVISNWIRSTYTSSSSSNFTPWIKTEKWFSSAVKRLQSKKITASTLLLEHSYFHPVPGQKNEILDGIINSCTKCSHKTEIVVLILSKPFDTDMRQAIRETWGSVAAQGTWPWVNFTMNIRLVFVLGVHKDNVEDNTIKVDSIRESDYKSNINSVLLSKLSKLKSEAAHHNDLLQLTTIDDYKNLTRKLILGIGWITKNCPNARYILKADQDIFVNVPLIWYFLNCKGQRNSIFGHMYFHGHVRREGRWGVAQSVLPIDRFPVYASGTAYILSMDAGSKIIQSYSRFPYLHIEDAFITGIVASVTQIDRYHVKGFTEWANDTPDSCEIVMDRTFAANNVNETIKRNIWAEIKEMGRGRCI